MALYRSTQVTPKAVKRISTGIYDLDYLYGMTDGVWGMPTGKISLLAGESGVGKTRLLVELVKHMVHRGNILFVQGELPNIGEFVSEKLEGHQYPNLYLTADIGLDDQLKYIRQLKPVLAIVDSAQQIDSWNHGRGAKDIIRRIRDVISETGTHVILVSQLNVDGSTKGGSEIGHEVDICLSATKRGLPEGEFNIRVNKHRYGRSGVVTRWQHSNAGVSCISSSRLIDERYRKTKPIGDSGVLDARMAWIVGSGPKPESEVKPKKGFWSRLVG